jgi:probable F420-dependent oxidoreductase
MELGTFGVWRRRQEGTEGLQEIETLGFSAFWIGSSPSVADARPFLEGSSTLTIATGILNIWQHAPAAVAPERAEAASEFPARFLLGIGVGHPEAIREYTKPLTAMRRFFDGLDAAAEPVPRGERIAAALGPKMLDLAAERSVGTLTYFATPEHTRLARERVGPGTVVAVELAVVLETDPEVAREHARTYAQTYLSASNYLANLRRLGFGGRDFGDGGSDRLIDAVIPHGSPEQVADAVRSYLDAGADHVCLQPLGHGPAPVDDYRALASVLL